MDSWISLRMHLGHTARADPGRNHGQVPGAAGLQRDQWRGRAWPELPLCLAPRCVTTKFSRHDYSVVGGSRWQSRLTARAAARRGADRHRQPAALRGGPSRGMGARQPRLALDTCHCQPFLQADGSFSSFLLDRKLNKVPHRDVLGPGPGNTVAIPIDGKVIWAPPCIFP